MQIKGMFQSTLQHGERLLPPRYQQALCLRFNPRSHMGSDFAEIVAMAARFVSIHAPTWGATYLLYLCTKFNSVSIHAPTWGATSIALLGRFGRYCFNPRSHMGSDNDTALMFIIPLCFNPRSHMGSDICIVLMQTFYWCFNPRSHMGSDRPFNNQEECWNVSIHAPTWGATGGVVVSLHIIRSFNPRSHMGSDPAR